MFFRAWQMVAVIFVRLFEMSYLSTVLIFTLGTVLV